MRNNSLITLLSAVGLALATQAKADITFTFLENGPNVDLGTTSTFTESGITLSAAGFTTPGNAAANLFAKFTSGDPTETGLGMVVDSGNDNEIDSAHFVQLTLPTAPPTTLKYVLLGSVQAGESANVYFTTTPGSLVGATLVGTLSGVNSHIDIPAGDTTGYLDITGGGVAGANVLVTGLVAVPEPSTMIAGAMLLLPFGLQSIRHLRSRK